MREANADVKEPDVGALVLTVERRGQEGKRQGVDRKVADSKENEGKHGQPLAVNQGDHYQANSTEYEAGGVPLFPRRRLGVGVEEVSADSGDTKDGGEDSVPVAGRLKAGTGGVSRVPDVFREGAGCVSPNIHDADPAEKLYQTEFPKGPGSNLCEVPEAGGLLVVLRIDPVVLSVGLGIVFLNVEDGPHTGNQQDGRRDHVSVDDGIWCYSPLRRIMHSTSSEDKGQQGGQDAPAVEEDLLEGPGEVLLLVVHHVTDDHPEGLHTNVVEEAHEADGKGSKGHCGHRTVVEAEGARER